MMRFTTLIWVVVLSVSAFALYKVKFQVQTLRGQIAEVSQELARERESLNVVAAEWAYLNRPDRLQKLAEAYLNYEAVTVEHIADIQAIPFPQVMEAKVQNQPNLAVTTVSQREPMMGAEAE